MAAASAGTSRLGVSDNQKRWLVAGIALNKVLVPQIRPFVEQEVNKEYNNLKTSHNIHAQTTSGRLQRWPPRKFLKYENINGNDAHPKLSGGRYDYSLFDCRVLSHIDFARLYVDNYMAKFNAFDEHCDASAVLLLLGGVPVFSAAVQAAAGDVRMARNDWAHCVFSKWDEAKFQQSFIEMEDLVRAMVLPAADKGKILGELKDWETKGPQLCMNSPVDPALLHLVHQEVKSLEDNLDKLSVEFEEERAKVRQLLRTVSTDLEQMRQSVLRLKTGQQNLECRTGIVEERMDDVEGRINDFEEDANQRIGNLESFQQNTESRSGQVESRMDNMENRMEDFQETFQSLTLRENESTLTSSPQDMPAAMPEKLVELIRRDYKGAVLCPFPWCEDELQLELCNVFTRLQIVSKKKERAKLTDDTVNMTDVFRPHAECNKPRVVLIEGVPGMGKTTYCQKLAYDWSIGEIPPEASFPGVEMLLLLKCRDMNTADIEKAIDDQLLPQDVDEKEKKNFFHFIRSNQSRILLVLDGLDELRQDLFQSFLPLIQGKVFFNTYVMLTARHEAGKKVRRHCDTLLEIVGYTHDDAKSYVKKYFSNHEDPSLGEKMITKLQSDGQLKELTSNPLNTALLCLLCEETSGTFPSKRTTIYDALVECAIRRYFTKRGVSLDDGNPTERFADQLIQLGKVAFEALLKNQLYFSADEMECQTTDFLQLCFLSREPSASKIRPTPCYAFTHKTFQEYFAALYLAHQVLTGDQGGKALLARLSPVDNWQVWEFLLTMVISKNSEKGVFVVSRLCSFYCKRPRHLSTMGDADADADSNVDICESHPFEWIASCGVESWSEDESALDDVVKKALHFIAECEDGKNELEDYQKKMVQVVARCLPVHKLELELDLELSFCFVYSEYLKTNCTLTDLHLHGPLSKVLLTTISSALHPKNKLLYLHLSDMLFLCRSEDSDNLAKHDNGFDFKMLGTVLQSGHCLTHFNLHDIQIFDDGGEAVAKALQGNHTITHLHLESVTICDSGAIALACFLQSNCTLSHLSLLGSWISGIGAGALADGLQSNRTLKSLNLSDSRFGDSVARGLARVLKSQCAMRYLKLSNSFDWTDQNLPFSFRRFEVIRTSGASALARALRLNYSLTYLDLQYNAISDSGAAATAEALKSNCTLTELYLNENKIGESGGEALGKALQSNRTLTHLLLGRNRIGDSGAKAMAKALQSRGTQLTCLGLCSNKISCSGATAIADSLQCNCSLTHLGLSDNEIASSGAVAFAKALQSNCTLTQSDVRDNDNNNDSGATESAQAPLHHNNTLIYLDLESNPIGSLGADILGELSERSSCTVKYGRPQD